MIVLALLPLILNARNGLLATVTVFSGTGSEAVDFEGGFTEAANS
jgi:hypothetical protein